MSNRLAGESSPYLLQHADNPVDWYPWGAEAFETAKRLDKPVFVSIGYAACHWCHVMAHESFESEEIAALMNELYVNVKVDREERPDVDTIYMNAIQVLGEGGGWPLSAFCLPDGRPFFLGTYFPPKDRFGRPGFIKVLKAMSQAYASERDKVMENVEGLIEGLQHVDGHYRGASAGDPAALSTSMIVAAGRQIAQRCDGEGGLAGAPKFPSTSAHELLGRASRLSFGQPAREAYLLWARKMAEGGIYDHLGGGFARYAVDAHWLVPHFEKMLYDNGQLLGVYADAFAMTGERRFAEVIEETVVWLEREMGDPSGGLWASLDADSEGEEGKFYVWKPAEVTAALGFEAVHLMRAYGVTDEGNFEHGATVLSRVTPRGAASDEEHLRVLRDKLLAARAKRVRPATDDKLLAGWNALAVSGLVRAWNATGHAPALALAVRVGEFLRREMIRGDRLVRTWKAGAGKLDGTLDDYAFTALAMMELAEATLDRAWWDAGAALAGAIRTRFYQLVNGAGVFYLTPHDDPEPLIHRPESHHDGALPSGAAVAIEVMVRLGHIAGDDDALGLAERYLARRLGGDALGPLGAARLLGALDLFLNAQCVVVSDGAGREALLDAARRAYAPTRLIAGDWAAASVREGKTAKDGTARAFVCKGPVCSAPVTEAAALRDLLGERERA